MNAKRIDQYWNARFALKPDMLYQDGVRVIPHPTPENDTFAYIFVRGDTCVVAVAEKLVNTTCDRVGKWKPESLLAQANLRQAFEQPIHHTVGPAYQGYAEVEDLSPQLRGSARKLGTEASQALLVFKGACEPIAWQHSCIDKAASGLFGSFAGDDLAAVAHYSMWRDDVASIGVLTHPGNRGHGHGKAVVSAAMADAFQQGHLVVYQTLESNLPSVALARAVGFKDYARTVAVHLIESGS